MSKATQAADQAQTWANNGMLVGWTNHQPASSLVAWSRLRAATPGPVKPPVPIMGPALDMVCYELPIWAAFYGNALTLDELYNLAREFDNTHHGSAAGIMGAITSGWSLRRTLTDITAPRFSRGDIVFFNGVGHVAIASGSVTVPNEVYSVWGMDPSGMAANTPVVTTTVGALLAQIAIGAPNMAQVVTYSSPRW